MLIIPKKYLYVLLALAILSIALLSFSYYQVFTSAAANNLQLKYQAENIVFIGVVTAILIFLAFVITFYRSRDVLGRLDKVIELAKSGVYEIDEYLKKDAELGDKISKIIHNMSELNKLKSLKISALLNINEYFIRNLRNMSFLLDSRGVIELVNEKLISDYDLKENIFMDKKIDNYFIELNFQDILFELNKNHASIQQKDVKIKINNKESKEDILFIPIFNNHSKLAYIICTTGIKDFNFIQTKYESREAPTTIKEKAKEKISVFRYSLDKLHNYIKKI